MLPGDAGIGMVFATTVFGFLSWAGFEGAATLGEETREPRRNIPRAIWVSVVLLGVFYTLCMYVQISGFGVDEAGVDAFASSGGTLADLAQTYIGETFAVLINIGAVASAFASATGCTAAASRVLFAMGRDGFGPKALGRKNEKHDIPRNAVYTVLALVVVVMGLVALLPGGDQVTNQFFWSATLASLVLIVVYGMTSVALLVRSVRQPAGLGVVDRVLPVLSVAFLGYVFWENRGTEPPYDVFPYIAAGWLAVGLLLVCVLPGLTRRIGASLVAGEGFGQVEGPKS
ncbi:MAG: amino acid permease [Streptosporangiales bacterium]|nr:amino acid permease [Streptosporangiales bacterium]